MVVVGMRDDHRVEVARLEREPAVGAVGVDPVGVKQPAVEQDPVAADLQQVGAARDLAGRAVERDSQTIVLPLRATDPAAGTANAGGGRPPDPPREDTPGPGPTIGCRVVFFRIFADPMMP